jgi:hypothetical protein
MMFNTQIPLTSFQWGANHSESIFNPYRCLIMMLEEVDSIRGAQYSPAPMPNPTLPSSLCFCYSRPSASGG